MSVVDASVVVAALTDPGRLGMVAAESLLMDGTAAPHLLDLEVAQGIRGLVRGNRVDQTAGGRALLQLRRIAIERFPHEALMPRIWALRDSLTSYDASYVALAELLGRPLVTLDPRLAGAPGLQCVIKVIR